MSSVFTCTALVVTEFIFVPLYLKQMWPNKNLLSLFYKMICASCYLLIGITAIRHSGGFTPYTRLLLCALVAGWFGDLFLHIPKGNRKLFFILGLVWFITAHVFFCAAYAQIQAELLPDKPFLTKAELLTAAIIVTVFFVFTFIRGVRFEMFFIPAVIYGIFVTVMMLKAVGIGVELFKLGNTVPALLLLAGGLCFIQSDASLSLIYFDTRSKMFSLKVYNIITYFLAETCLAFTCFCF